VESLEWFIYTGWNSALEAADAGQHQSTTVGPPCGPRSPPCPAAADPVPCGPHRAAAASTWPICRSIRWLSPAAAAAAWRLPQVLMASCASLLEAHPSPSTSQLDTQKLAYLMAATAALDVRALGGPCCLLALRACLPGRCQGQLPGAGSPHQQPGR
jgi:hypothetical protein